MSQVERRALILTALSVEYAAVRAYLKNIREEEDTVGTVYELGTFGSSDSGWTVCLAEVGAGNVGAATHVERAISHFRPSVAFFVGIAGGIKDVSIGDVVVATKVYGYESGKSTSDGFLQRPDVATSSYRLIERARAEARRGLWCKHLSNLDSITASPRAFVAPIAAGEKVIASDESETARFLKSSYSDALAVEMEGGGFLRALHAHVDTSSLVVRGISDLLSGKHDADRRGSQIIASQNAAAFAMAVLERLGGAPGAFELMRSGKRVTVFISYSHDSPEHEDRVRELAQQLRADGFDCRLDVFEREPPAIGWPLWMEKQLSESHFVLIVCSETFSRRFVGEDNPNVGLGAAWEPQTTENMLRGIGLGSSKFVPILLEGASVLDVPAALRHLARLRLPAEYDKLLTRLADDPPVVPPPTDFFQGSDSSDSMARANEPKSGGAKVLYSNSHSQVNSGEELAGELSTEATPPGDRPGSHGAKVFISYSHRDEVFREELDKHLSLLSRQGIIQLWHDRTIPPGSDWAGQIDASLAQADIVIILVSADFLASDYCYGVELRQALERHRLGKARIVPIVVRPCDWSSSPLGSIQALPRDARPVSTWANSDDAWLDVARALRTVATQGVEATQGVRGDSVKLIHRLVKKSDAHKSLRAIKPIEKIFPRGGVPELNYVSPHRLRYLKIYLRDQNGGVIVEGPSGIGKTTATRKLLDDLKVSEGSRRWFSAGNSEEVESLQRVLDSPPGGIVVVDDFHHLTLELKTRTARAIKYACDNSEGPTTKFVLIGINKVGYALLDSFPDLHGRVITFSMGRQPDEKIEEMIRLGEAAANIRFVKKSEITIEAAGSFFMAQQLCFFAAMAAGIEETQAELTDVQQSVSEITPDILEYQRLKFHKPVMEFACFDSGTDQRGACLALLYRIAFDSDGCVLVEDVRRQYPNLDASFAWLDSGEASRHREASTLLAGLFHFDPAAGVFSAEDPQLQFYMKHLEWTTLAKHAGLKARVTPDGWLHIG